VRASKQSIKTPRHMLSVINTTTSAENRRGSDQRDMISSKVKKEMIEQRRKK
jgi:hypothetical protein